MVFFTCNHCGDSVKKPAVAKHYATKCRKSVFVSCMDCLKDFHENYVEHTRCITEAEKYSGKDYVAKEPKNSGLKKQESWLEIVRSILTTREYEVTPAVRGIFQKLQSYDNVPRKKAKFENFVSNSMHVKKDQAEAVWNVLEKALEKLKAAREKAIKNSEKSGENGTAEKEVGNKEANESQQTEQDDDGNNEECVQVNSKQKKNKKKRKEELSEVNNHEETPEEPAKKKKKKNKAPAEENKAQDAVEITITNGHVESSEQVSKKKNKSKKKSQDAENGEAIPLANANGEEKTSLKCPLNTQNESFMEQEDAPSKKKKKSDQIPEEESPTKQDKFKVEEFNWSEVIFKVLGKHNDEISLDKLKTKVLKKYKVSHQLDEIPWKLEKTFNKKLRNSGLLIENDIVKINVK